MPIAKGAKSVVKWAAESTWGVSPTTGFKAVSFISETLGESINPIMSDELRPDRTVPNARGGNIKAGGEVVMDLGPSRHGRWLEHLLGSSVVDAAQTPVELVGATFLVGDVRKSNGGVFVCVQAGVVTNGAATAVTADNVTDTCVYGSVHGLVTGNAVILAASVLPSGLTAGTYYVRVVDTLTVGLYPTRADALANTNKVTWTTNGTTVTLAAAPNLTAANGVYTTGAARFVYIGADSLSLTKHTITAGADYPTGGISIEKGIRGGDSEMWLVFSGCRMNTLSVDVPQEGIIKTTWGVLAKAVAQSASASASPGADITDYACVGYETVVCVGTDTTSRPIKELKLDITNNVQEDVFTVNSRYREELPEARREIKGNIGVYFKDATDYNRFKNETTFAMTVTFYRASGGVIIFEFPEVKIFGSPTPQVSGNNVIMSSFDFNVFRNLAAYDCRVTIVDTNSTLL